MAEEEGFVISAVITAVGLTEGLVVEEGFTGDGRGKNVRESI